MDVDDENRVRGLVWVDPHSINAYKNFGDVVTFDSTYRTNRDETEISYKWVLKTWLEAIDNIPPITIITDQDIALSNAIAEVIPQTKHIYCTWHISQKFGKKLSPLYQQYPEFKSDFNGCVYKSLSPTEFEGRWEELVEKYHIEDHDWLNVMFGIRNQWIYAYTKQHFTAGMITTSRSKSMNAFFDKYVQASTGLKDFIENSQKALEVQYLNEVKEDYETKYKQRRLVLNLSMEIFASKIYTKEMFRHFQKELLKSTSYTITRAKESGSFMIKLYLVAKYMVSEGNRKTYLLMVPMYGMIECNCKKFEHSGMICRHMICYLDKKQKTIILSEYINLTWMMNGKKIAGPLPYTPPALANVGDSQSGRYSALCKSFQSLGAIGSFSVSRYNCIMGVIERERCYVKSIFRKMNAMKEWTSRSVKRANMIRY